MFSILHMEGFVIATNCIMYELADHTHTYGACTCTLTGSETTLVISKVKSSISVSESEMNHIGKINETHAEFCTLTITVHIPAASCDANIISPSTLCRNEVYTHVKYPTAQYQDFKN